MYFIGRVTTRLFFLLAYLALAVVGAPSIAWSTEPPHAIEPLAPQSPYRYSLTQFQHRSYSSRDGAPANAQAMVQTPDGFLWIGTQNGLFRFDGVRFDHGPTDLLPKTNVSYLFAEPNGDLWIGYTFGGISLLHQGRISNIPDASLPGGSVLGFARTTDGSLWVATTRGIARQHKGLWEKIARPTDGDPAHEPQWLGRINGRIYFFEPRAAYVIDDKTGQLLPTDFAKAKHDLLGLPASVPWNESYNVYWASLRDPSGAFWVTREDREGITRVRWKDNEDAIASEERLGKTQGLTGEFGLVYFMDREANIWVATEQGIDRFSMGKFTPVVFPGRMSELTIAADRSGGLWVGSLRENALYLKGEAPPVRIEGMGPGSDCSVVDHRGAVWMTGYADLEVYDGVRVTHVPPPSGTLRNERGQEVLQPCQNVAEDAEGDMWLSLAKVGIFRLSGDTWQPGGGLKDLPSGPAIRVIADEKGRIWLGYPNNRIAMIDHDRLMLYGHNEGLTIGNVLSLSVRGAHVWAAGDNGVAYLASNNRFVNFQTEGGNALRGVSGIVETSQGDLWLNSPEGVYRITASQIELLMHSPGYRPSYELFTQDDGINGQPKSIRPGPTMVESADGRIWVATKQDLAWIDPSHIRYNKVAPTITVSGFTADGTSWPLSSIPTLPPLTGNLRIDYTAPALSMPERVRFRYRLEGVDNGWQDAGGRREAFYTHLLPGTYHFNVMAINEDGVTSATATNFIFKVTPAFYQTLWFKSLVVGLAVLVAWCLYAFRVSFIARRYRLLLHERSEERERIARDLHDTLLQGMQGILLQIELWTHAPSLSDAQRDGALKIEDKMRSMLIEGRDTISALRQSQDHQTGLIAELLDFGNEAAARSETRFSIRLISEPRDLLDDACEEVLAITREAILNAFKHAQAEAVWVVVDYAPHALTLSICDNGLGVSNQRIEERQKEGHWGIAGMRERAAKLGGQLIVTSCPGNGTSIELEIPRRRAYVSAPFFVRVGTSLRKKWNDLMGGGENR
jgi:signal transduction histidine kinase/ligand-binding sensor domain-containing protein